MTIYNLRNLPPSTNNNNTGCGFILMNNNDQMEILYLVRPYSNTYLRKDNVQMPASLKLYNKRDRVYHYQYYNYAERLTIPRGKGEHKETLLATALREFMEETSLRLEHIKIFNYFFRLTFEDDRIYTYTIFMGYSTIQCLRHPSNRYLSVKYCQQENVFKVAETVKDGTLENCKLANAKIQYRDYIRFMQDYQLKCYKNSNYRDLFNFISFMICKKKECPLQLSDDPEQPIYCWNDAIYSHDAHYLKPVKFLDIKLKYHSF